MVDLSKHENRIQRSAYLEHLRSTRASTRDIRRVLRDAAEEARAVVTTIVGDSVSASLARARADAVAQALTAQSDALWGTVERSTRQGIARVTQDAMNGQIQMTGYLANIADPGVRDLIVRAAAHSIENVRANILSRVDLSTAVYRNGQVGIKRVRKVVERGIAKNLTAKQLAGQVAHLINPNTPGGVSYAAMRLARTEINNSFHAVNSEWFDESPFVEAVQWNLSSSHPIKDVCDEYAEGGSSNLGAGFWLPHDVPPKPHPHCFCYTTAETPDRDVFVDRLKAGQYDQWMSRAVGIRS